MFGGVIRTIFIIILTLAVTYILIKNPESQQKVLSIFQKSTKQKENVEKELHNKDKNDEPLTDLTDYRNTNLARPNLEMRNLKVLYSNLARDKQQSQTYTTVE